VERLISYFVPENYRLKLNIDKNSEKILGRVIITGKTKNELAKFNAKGLEILSVKNEKGDDLQFSHSDDILDINVEKPGEKVIEVEFNGKLSHNMEGAYLSTYQFEDREERIVSTQFESCYARECFPCVDEPEAKATFDLTLTVADAFDTVLSNMPAKKTTVMVVSDGEKSATSTGSATEKVVKSENEILKLSKTGRLLEKTVEFETTPKMSSYLLAFVFGKFNKLSAETFHGVKITTYAALNQPKSLLKFPNDVAAKAIDLYDDLFDVPFPLPKLDQVALPDFEAGAMENWGLVTYREACLLADEKSPQSQKEYVTTVITHELSHQWFGDLVTMKWWNNLWLNESFANMMQYYSVDKLYPEWNIFEDFFTGDCYAALLRDALPGVQSVQQDVEDPSEIAALFDASIVYAKGSHLMFMLMRLMGEKPFFAGLKSYFKKHKYGNTTENDLWTALQPHAKFNVAEFMNAWISQPGYPMVVDEHQQRFLFTGDTDDTKWPLPKITDDMSGHYLINLSGPEFDEKIAQFDKLKTEQKIRLLIDRYLLSKTPIVSSGSLMDLLPKLKNETHQSIFGVATGILNVLKIFASPDTEYYPKFQKFALDFAMPNLERLGLTPGKNDSDDDTSIRDLVIGLALYAKHEATVSKLAKVFDEFAVRGSDTTGADIYNIYSKSTDTIFNYDELHPEIRSSTLSAKMIESEEKVFDGFLSDYQKVANPDLKAELLSALTDVERPETVEKVLALLEQPEIVRPQDHVYLFSYLLSNFYTREQTFSWLYSHWDYLVNLVSEQSSDDYLRIAAARIRTKKQRDDFFEFVEPLKNHLAYARTIEVARADVDSRLAWFEEDKDAVRRRLKDF